MREVVALGTLPRVHVIPRAESRFAITYCFAGGRSRTYSMGQLWISPSGGSFAVRVALATRRGLERAVAVIAR